jgi:hypothetical protein
MEFSWRGFVGQSADTSAPIHSHRTINQAAQSFFACSTTTASKISRAITWRLNLEGVPGYKL